MDALLKSPDRRTELGDRDHTILLFLYNSGARADEAAGLLIRDLHLKAAPAVRIVGKGNKHRLCPLWPTTVSALSRLIVGRTETHDPLRHTQACHSLREVGIEVRTVADRQARQPAYSPAHHGGPSTPLGRGHQHHSGVAGSCFARHYARVRGG